MKPIRVVLADDHSIIRSGIKKILQATEEILVVGEAEDGEAALKLVEAVDPDVLILDLEMPGMNGYDVAQHVRDHDLSVEILVLSAHTNSYSKKKMLDLGAKAYISKREAPERLVAAVVTAGRPSQVSK